MTNTYHMVVVKFKADAPVDAAEQLFAALAELKKLLPGMLSFKAGSNNSQEGLSKGFTHAFVMAFEDAKARDTYLFHPEHEKVKETFIPMVEDILVFDFDG